MVLMAEYDPPESSFLIWMNTHSFPFFISLVSLMLIYTMAQTSAALAFVQRLLLVLPLYTNIIPLRFVILVLLVIQCESCFIFFLVVIQVGVNVCLNMAGKRMELFQVILAKLACENLTARDPNRSALCDYPLHDSSLPILRSTSGSCWRQI